VKIFYDEYKSQHQENQTFGVVWIIPL